MDKQHYFYRAAVFTRKNQQVALIDMNNPDSSPPLEPWLGMAVSLADGQHTIQQLIDYIASQYTNSAPPHLDKTICSALERLSENDVIRFSDKPISLPYYLALPYEELDLDKARKLMLKDGHIPH